MFQFLLLVCKILYDPFLFIILLPNQKAMIAENILCVSISHAATTPSNGTTVSSTTTTKSNTKKTENVEDAFDQLFNS